jgi:hypothetical protein
MNRKLEYSFFVRDAAAFRRYQCHKTTYHELGTNPVRLQPASCWFICFACFSTLKMDVMLLRNVASFSTNYTAIYPIKYDFDFTGCSVCDPLSNLTSSGSLSRHYDVTSVCRQFSRCSDANSCVCNPHTRSCELRCTAVLISLSAVIMKLELESCGRP